MPACIASGGRDSGTIRVESHAMLPHKLPNIAMYAGTALIHAEDAVRF
jgi:hypothetical protein